MRREKKSPEYYDTPWLKTLCEYPRSPLTIDTINTLRRSGMSELAVMAERMLKAQACRGFFGRLRCLRGRHYYGGETLTTETRIHTCQRCQKTLVLSRYCSRHGSVCPQLGIYHSDERAIETHPASDSHHHKSAR